MKIIFIIFLFFASFFLIASHWFIYYSLVKFLLINNPLGRKVLLSLIICLTSSFFIANFLINWKINASIRFFYYVSSAWALLVFYLVIGFIVLWFISNYFNFRHPYFAIAMVLVIAAIIIHGFYNTQDINIKKLNIPINNLPSSWQNKKVIQISDIHLGPIHRSEFIQKIVDLINKEKPAVVVITGDYFDGTKLGDDELVAPLKQIASEYGVYFVYGNHDYYHGLKMVEEKMSSANVTVLKNEIVDLDGLQIIGLDYQGLDAGNNFNIKDILDQKKADLPSIVLKHAPDSIAEVAQSGADLLLCGHTHLGQIWPNNLIVKAIYHKFAYGYNKFNNLQVYTSAGVGTWGPPVRLGNHPEIVVFTLQKP